MWRWASPGHGLVLDARDEDDSENYFTSIHWGDGEGAGYYWGNRLGGGYMPMSVFNHENSGPSWGTWP